MTSLLAQFLDDDATPAVRKLLLNRLAEWNENGISGCEKFSFNRFLVTLDVERSIVVIEDDLDIEGSGQQIVSLEAFRRAIDIP